jgi:hypothetical protein
MEVGGVDGVRFIVVHGDHKSAIAVLASGIGGKSG